MAAELGEEFVDIGGCKIQLLKGGAGEPLLVFHGGEGTIGWTRVLLSLAERFSVYLPSHPGYNQSERAEWLETVPDMSRFYVWFMRELGLEGVRAIGHSLGGWLAAEIAVSCPHAFSKLLLQDPAGIRPLRGKLLDVFAASPDERRERGFYDAKQVPDYDQLFQRPPTPEEQRVGERNRGMLFRLCQPPYLHNPSLPWWLRGVAVPTCIVWGRQDGIIPLECGELYSKAIPGAELVVIDRCGHRPYMEQPNEFLKAALEFLP